MTVRTDAKGIVDAFPVTVDGDVTTRDAKWRVDRLCFPRPQIRRVPEFSAGVRPLTRAVMKSSVVEIGPSPGCATPFVWLVSQVRRANITGRARSPGKRDDPVMRMLRSWNLGTNTIASTK